MSVELTRGKVYVVERPQPKLRAGQGMLAGLGVVMQHFRAAFGQRSDEPGEQTGMRTVQYPEERRALPQAFRSFPILLYDDATGQELCTSCFQCQRICPPQVIHMTQEHDPATGKPVPAVGQFVIEYDACMSCGLCAEVCPFDAIKMDHEFELSTDTHGGLTIDKVGLNRPVSYYQQLAPSFWAEVEESAAKKLQGNIKRRSGQIGVAPNVSGAPGAAVGGNAPDGPDTSVRAQGAAPLPMPDAPIPSAPVDVMPAPLPVPDAPAAPAPDVPVDKAARLAAIRARNAAKGGNDPSGGQP